MSCRLPVSIAALVGVACLSGCASAQFNSDECQRYGLPSGSSAYRQCVREGADAYAELHPLTGGHSCSAPPSSPGGHCPGCSVSCGEREAYCARGRELWTDVEDACITPAVCDCLR